MLLLFIYDAVSTPVYVGSHCLDQPVIELVTYPHVNILYLAQVLNRSVSDSTFINTTMYTDLPIIKLPKYLKNLALLKGTKEPIYDLKRILKLHRNNYRSAIPSKVAVNTEKLKGLYYLRITLYLIVAVTITIIVAGICLGCRIKKLESFFND